MEQNPTHNTDILRNYAAELLVDIAFDTSAPNLGNNAAEHLDRYLSDEASLQLLAMSVFRRSQVLDYGTNKMLQSALSQFDTENSYIGTAARRVQGYIKAAGREAQVAPVSNRPVGYGAVIF